MQNINSLVFFQLAAVIHVGRVGNAAVCILHLILFWFSDASRNKLNRLLPPSQELVTKAEIK